VGLQIYSSADAAKNDALDTIGGSIVYEMNGNHEDPSEQRISNEIRKQILPIDHVIGVNRHIADYAFPVDFENVRDYTGETPISDPSLYEVDSENLRPYSVIVDANTDCSLIDDFRLEKALLTGGEFPTVEHPGVVIEQHLSEQNGLTIGDAITFTVPGGKDVTALITGVYRTTGSFHITGDNYLGEAIFAMSPYNRIYTSLDVGTSLYRVDPESLSLTIHIDQPQNVEIVGKEIKNLDLNWKDYALVNMTATLYSIEGTQIENLSGYAKAILLYVILIGAILISLVLTIYVRYYIHDAGIFIALGANKSRVVLQYAIAMIAVVLSALLVSVIVSNIISGEITNSFIEQTATSSTTTYSYVSGLNPNYDVQIRGFRPIDYGYFMGVAMLFLIISCGHLALEIIRYQPRSILINKRG
jgi:putative ABC transport system permease protein